MLFKTYIMFFYLIHRTQKEFYKMKMKMNSDQCHHKCGPFDVYTVFV